MNADKTQIRNWKSTVGLHLPQDHLVDSLIVHARLVVTYAFDEKLANQPHNCAGTQRRTDVQNEGGEIKYVSIADAPFFPYQQRKTDPTDVIATVGYA